MNSILEYQFITPYRICLDYVRCMGEYPVVFEWLLNGKIAENPVVEPSNSSQVVEPSGKNRYLQSVTVSAYSPAVYTVSVAVAGTSTFAITDAVTAVSDVAATATATVASGNVTVTGVAAGTTAVRVYDSSSTLIGIIVVTVA